MKLRPNSDTTIAFCAALCGAIAIRYEVPIFLNFSIGFLFGGVLWNLMLFRGSYLKLKKQAEKAEQLAKDTQKQFESISKNKIGDENFHITEQTESASRLTLEAYIRHGVKYSEYEGNNRFNGMPIPQGYEAIYIPKGEWGTPDALQLRKIKKGNENEL